MKTICLFDLDGTLTDPFEGISKAFAYSLDYFGVPMPEPESLKKYIGPPLRESFTDFVPHESIEDAVAKFREYYATTGLLENRLYDGIAELLLKLKTEGFTLAVATSKVMEYAGIIINHFGIGEYFDYIAGCELDGTRSAKSEVIEHALDVLKPDNNITVVMIGDRKHDIVGAKAMGALSIGITWGYGTREELTEAGATWIANTPEEVYEVLNTTPHHNTSTITQPPCHN